MTTSNVSAVQPSPAAAPTLDLGATGGPEVAPAVDSSSSVSTPLASFNPVGMLAGFAVKLFDLGIDFLKKLSG
jgi:hypothetical protein